MQRRKAKIRSEREGPQGLLRCMVWRWVKEADLDVEDAVIFVLGDQDG